MGADKLLLSLSCPTPMGFTCMLWAGVVDPLPRLPTSFHAWGSSSPAAWCLTKPLLGADGTSEDIIHAAVVRKLVKLVKPNNQPGRTGLTGGVVVEAHELALLARKLLKLIRQHFQLNGQLACCEVRVLSND